MSSPPRRSVYLLRSETNPSRHYVGLTSDLTRRLASHNAGLSVHTARARPWRLLVSISFADEATAARFERYLKSGSGRAFAVRHFCPVDDHAGVSASPAPASG
jgi:predicted GIY-YIG superfamily endonuclease